MGRIFRIKLHVRRFSRRHPWLVFFVRSVMVFSAAFGGAYGFIAGSTSPNSGYDPYAFAIGASFLFPLACLALAILSAFVEAQRVSSTSSRTSVPAVPQHANPHYEPVCSDNFA